MRWLLALALLPVCMGASWALIDVLALAGRAAQVWVPLLVGGTCWIVLFLSLPKPMWLYVVGHELTHALWAWMFGGRVKKFKATARGGHVVLTKTNLFITLSPYFFPLYAVLWTGCFLLGNALFGWRDGRPWFHFGLGFAYAFHVTLTAHILRTRQPDLESEGWVFSAVVIWLGNVLTLLAALALITRVVSLLTALGWVLQRTGRVLSGLG